MQSFLSGAIARIYDAENCVVGAGFLISRRLLVTCTHVIQNALRLPDEPVNMPSGNINIDFPLLPGTDIFSAKIVGWSPDWSKYGGDVAILEIDNTISVDLIPAPLVIVENIAGHSFHCFGFPVEYDRGVWAQGKIKGRLSEGWIQIQSQADNTQAGNDVYSISPETIQRGYSGVPVWDDELDGIIGMVVGAEANRSAAFIIPIDVILGKFTFMQPSNLMVQVNPNREKEYLKSFIENSAKRLNHAYIIPLSAQTDAAFPVSGGQKDNKKQNIPLPDVESAQALFDRFILTGVAGSGKSTVLRQMGLTSAQERLDGKQSSQLPLIISLAEWHDDISFDDFLRSHWPFSVDPSVVWKPYQIQLYLDGLNEMGAGWQRKSEQIKTWMESPLSPEKIIISCRINDPLLANFDLPNVNLEPLNTKQVNAFALGYLEDKSGLFWSMINTMQSSGGHPLDALIRTPFFLTSLMSIYRETGNIPQNQGILLQQLSTLLWTREKKRHSIRSEEVDEIQRKLGVLSITMYREGHSDGLAESRAMDFLSHEEIDLAVSANILVLDNDTIRFYHAALGAYYAATQIQISELEKIVSDDLDDAVKNLNFVRVLKTVINGKWYEVILIFSCIIGNADLAIITIASKNMLLGAECIASGIELSSQLRDSLTKKIVVWLIEQLNDSELYIGTKGAYFLSQLIGKDAIPYLAPLLLDENDNLSIAAAQSLATLGKESVPVFIDLLGEETVNNYAMLLGFRELGRIAVPSLLQALHDKDKNFSACMVLKEIAPDVLLDGLLSVLRNPDKEVRSRAGVSIHVWIGKEAEPALVKLLRDPLKDVRDQAINILGLHNDVLPGKLLYEELRKPDWRLIESLANLYVLSGYKVITKWNKTKGDYQNLDLDESQQIIFEGSRICRGLVEKYKDDPDSDRVLDEYTRMIKSPDRHERAIAVIGAKQLDQIGSWNRTPATDEKARKIFLLALSDQDLSINTYSIMGLQIYVDISLLPDLVNFLQKKPGNSYLFNDLFSSIGTPALPALINLLRHSKTAVREAALNIMEQLPDPMLIPYLIPFLSETRDNTSGSASNVLEAIGEPAIPALLKALQNKKMSSMALITLKQIKSSRLVPGLVELYARANYDTKMYIIMTLEGINNSDAQNFLMEVASKKYSGLFYSRRESFHSDHALQCLGNMRAVTALPLIIQKAQGKEMRKTAIEALVHFEDPEAIPVLLPALAEKDIEVRIAAGWALIKQGKQALPQLLEALADPNPLIRHGAAWVLGEIGDQSAVIPLIRCLPDEEKIPGQSARVCDTVADALVRLNTSSAVASVEAWRVANR